MWNKWSRCRCSSCWCLTCRTWRLSTLSTGGVCWTRQSAWQSRWLSEIAVVDCALSSSPRDFTTCHCRCSISGRVSQDSAHTLPSFKACLLFYAFYLMYNSYNNNSSVTVILPVIVINNLTQVVHSLVSVSVPYLSDVVDPASSWMGWIHWATRWHHSALFVASSSASKLGSAHILQISSDNVYPVFPWPFSFIHYSPTTTRYSGVLHS